MSSFFVKFAVFFLTLHFIRKSDADGPFNFMKVDVFRGHEKYFVTISRTDPTNDRVKTMKELERPEPTEWR